MAFKLYQILSTLFFLYTTLYYTTSVVGDQVTGQECPYPCYPPPIGGGSGSGGSSSGSGGSSGSGNTPSATKYPPPSQIGYYPPPSSIFPYNPPNPNYYGNGPPSPDPIVPWFPFYYKKPPHQTADQSNLSSGVRIKSTVRIFLIPILVFSCLLLAP